MTSHKRPRARRTRHTAAAGTTLALLFTSAAAAAWVVGSAPGAAAAKAASVPQVVGAAAAFGNGEVAVSWSAATVAVGVPVSGYTVLAYPSGGGSPRTPGGTCAGTVTGTSCTDPTAPAGSWGYQIQATLASWTGPQSAPASVTVTANEIAVENALPGSPATEWDITGAGDDSIQGFATDISVDQGGAVAFKINTPSTDYKIDIYRLGYYGGSGARRVDTIQPSATLPQVQPACLEIDGTTNDNLIDCGNWVVSASWAVPSTAVSGIYLARPTREDGADVGKASHIVFIVRDDDGGSDLLFQTSDSTWQAYNMYGGYSLYQGYLGHAHKVSYNRPFSTRLSPTEDWLFNAEYPMVRWLERNGYDVSYSTDVDSDRRGSELLDHEAFLSVGHDEYWSGQQRANVEAARDAGVDLAFLSGNEIYWKTRWEPSTADGGRTDHRTLVSYKEGDAQPGEHYDCAGNFACDPDPTVWTGLWRQNAAGHDGGRPENALSGQISWGDSTTAIQVPAADTGLRFWRNTDMSGVTTLAANTLGYEFDWEQPAYASSNPPGRITVSDTTAVGKNHRMSMYRAPSGARVFGAGTVQWSWGLDGTHDRGTSTEDPRIQQATVNLFADMGVQPGALQGGLVAATQTTDAAGPTSTITAPTNGGSIPAGASVTVTGTATDSGGLVGGVEVSTDNGATWRPATGRGTWEFTFTTPNTTGTTVQIRARAIDDSLNTGAPSAAITVTTAPKVCDASTPCSIYSAASPLASDVTDGPPLELGVRFQSDSAGRVTGIRFFKPGTETRIYTGNLYTNTGTLLGSSPATSVTGSGWQVLPLTAAVDVVPGTTYVASYYSHSGWFAYTAGSAPGNLNTAVVNPPLTAPAHTAPAPNAVFKYGAPGGFPNTTPNPAGANYWADVTFETGTDTTAPTVTTRTPLPGSTDVALSSAVVATFSEPIDPTTVTASTFTLTGPGTTAVAATVGAVGNQAALTPTTALALGTTYTATLVGGTGGLKDIAGNPLAGDVTWTFTTTVTTSYTIFGTGFTGVDSNDGGSVELGVKLRVSSAGSVTRVRFYKVLTEGQTYTARVYSNAGALLGSSAPTAVAGTGWQELTLTGPIPLEPGTTYVASVFMPGGRYAVTTQGLASAIVAPPITALASAEAGGNGVYTYGPSGGFPASTFNNANYWVDVVFTLGSDVTAPEVTSVSPADTATGVQVSANVTGTFSEPVKASTVTGSTFTLTGPGNTPVGANVSTAGSTVTLDPAGDLTPGTVYTATLKGGVAGITDAADNPLATDFSWTFTTAAGPVQDYTIFGSTTGGTAYNDGNQPIEIGLKFRSSQAGSITKVRFLKLAPAGGTFTGKVYGLAGGTPLGQGSVTLASGVTGWQEIPLATPVAVDAGTTYVASYYSPNGDYVSSNGALSAAAVTNPPLTALQNGTDGPNGVYRYGAGYPDQSCGTCNGPNYWVDVVLSSGPLPPDTQAPTITSRTPGPDATAASAGTAVTVGFSEAVAPASVTNTSFTLTGPSGAVVGARSTNGSTITFTPTVGLTGEAVYTVLVQGGTGGVTDVAGNQLAANSSWSFTVAAAPTPRPDPNVGPGGPVLVVNGSGAFGSYLPEIMRAEGLNLFTVGATSALTSGGLAPYESVVLGETTLTGAQVTALTDWVTAGGNLVALRPDPQLAGLLGLVDTAGTLSEGYLKVDAAAAPGAGIVSETMQFHGLADRYGVSDGTQVVATLYSSAATATTDPAVTLRSVGTAGGSAAAFTYDLARSVVLTRQGNPDWVNQNRDGQDGPNRANDLFFGAKTGDVQPDYVDLSKVAIPQADEQQRLLANVLTETTLDAVPLPRFWYLPRGEVAAIVMTADEHDSGNVPTRFAQELAASAANCSVDDWDCIRSTSYLYPSYPSMSESQASGYEDQGFEIALHPNTACASPTRTQFADQLTTQLGDLATKYPGVDPSVTSRNHCIAWTDYTTIPEELGKKGIHLDTNYYYWPPGWVNNVPGMFTGSGFPQRFATSGGDLIDVYQATTQMTDESGQTFPYNAVTLMDNAINQGYYGTFVANLHTDGGSAGQYNADVIAAAKTRSVPVITAKQLLTWTDGRNASSFGDLGWNAGSGSLTFTITQAAGARGLESMLPLNSAGGTLQGLTGPSGLVPPVTKTIKGVDYAVFPAAAGAWTATYSVPGPDTTPPTVTATAPAATATNVPVGTTVTATFSEPVIGVGDATFTLMQGLDPVLGTVTYAAGPRTATFTPSAPLATGTTYTAGLTADITDASANPLAPVTWSFTTAAVVTPPSAPPVEDTHSPARTTSTAIEAFDFDGATLPAGWTSAPWSVGGTVIVGGGALTADGAAASGSAGRFRAIEARVTFNAGQFQNVGLAGDSEFNNPWFVFGMGVNTDQVYARDNSGTAFGLGSGLLGTQHTYRLEWTPTEVRWLVDGVLKRTQAVALGGTLVPIVSDFPVGGVAVVVDSLQTERYVDGDFTSQVFDAGVPSTWGAVNWTANLPTSTALQVQVRTGDTLAPDATWTSYAAVSAGQAPAGPPARYLQYRLVLTTTDPLVTPSVSQVTIGG